jgi:hypothetical protein
MVMVITMLPAIFGVFGLGVDTMRMVWVKASLQNELDQAVASATAVSVVINDAGNPVIDDAAVRERTRTLYAKNRAKYNMNCSTPTGTPAAIPGSTETRCWSQFMTTTPTGGGSVFGAPKVLNGTEVVYGVIETTDTLFLKVIGVKKQTYYIKSKAAITPSDLLTP